MPSLDSRINRTARLSGPFTLRSGTTSDTYFDKYQFESEPGLLHEIAVAMAPLVPTGTQVLAGLEMGRMASGDASLRLTTAVNRVLFGLYARAILWVLAGRIASKADSPFERAWEVVVDGHRYWLCFNDWQLGVSLDSRDAAGSDGLDSIRSRLVAWRDGGSAAS